jgi:hypothetical protein
VPTVNRQARSAVAPALSVTATRAMWSPGPSSAAAVIVGCVPPLDAGPGSGAPSTVTV